MRHQYHYVAARTFLIYIKGDASAFREVLDPDSERKVSRCVKCRGLWPAHCPKAHAHSQTLGDVVNSDRHDQEEDPPPTWFLKIDGLFKWFSSSSSTRTPSQNFKILQKF